MALSICPFRSVRFGVVCTVWCELCDARWTIRLLWLWRKRFACALLLCSQFDFCFLHRFRVRCDVPRDHVWASHTFRQKKKKNAHVLHVNRLNECWMRAATVRSVLVNERTIGAQLLMDARLTVFFRFDLLLSLIFENAIAIYYLMPFKRIYGGYFLCRLISMRTSRNGNAQHRRKT